MMKTKVVIEFSEKWLKVVVSTSHGVKSSIDKVILEPLPEATALSVSKVLASVFKQIGKRKGLDVIVVLSRNKMTVRKIDLPSRDSHEIEQMLSLHVIRQVPYAKEEIIWGYQNLGFDGISNSRILLGIAHRDILKNIFNSFLSLNILPDKMLLSSQGIIHYLYEFLKDKLVLQQPCLALDIDYNSSDLMLINKQQLNASVAISQGAEQLKTGEERLRFIVELKQALLAFRNDFSQQKLPQIFVSGVIEDNSPLVNLIEKEVNLRAEIVLANDKENLTLPSKEVSFAAVLGFAYQQKKGDISFILPEAQVKKEIKIKIQQLLIFGICLTYIFTVSGLIVFLQLLQRQSYQDRLMLEVKRLKEKAGTLMEIEEKINLTNQYTDPKYSVLNYLYELTRICPDSIVITSFLWGTQKGLVIRGYAGQMPDVFSFVSLLENSKFFKGVQARSTRRRKLENKEVVEFEIGPK